jgi:peptidoglycan glycosyltransferase
MLRRSAISFLLGGVGRMSARPSAPLERFLAAANGCAVLLDVATGRVLAVNGNPLCESLLVAPGSTLKPLSLAALMGAGKLRADALFYCPRRLVLAGRRMDCSHPPLAGPVGVEAALAYSCNCFTAWAAERFGHGELARLLRGAGLGAAEIRTAVSRETQQLQALGESDVLVTPVGLAHAYRQLALQVTRRNAGAGLEQVLAGLEGAVEFGTGQLARVAGSSVAGKTGSTRSGPNFIAWFAGFMPSRAPEVVVTVMVSGKHGGSDAAPVAGEILAAWRAGRL